MQKAAAGMDRLAGTLSKKAVCHWSKVIPAGGAVAEPLKAGARRGGLDKRSSGKDIPSDKEWKSVGVCVCVGGVWQRVRQRTTKVFFEKKYSETKRRLKDPTKGPISPLPLTHSALTLRN